jgi:hypothetical protein
LEFLKLRLEGVKVLGKFLPACLVLFGLPPGLVGAYQSYKRGNEDIANETQPD